MKEIGKMISLMVKNYYSINIVIILLTNGYK